MAQGTGLRRFRVVTQGTEHQPSHTLLVRGDEIRRESYEMSIVSGKEVVFSGNLGDLIFIVDEDAVVPYVATDAAHAGNECCQALQQEIHRQ